jgi:tetratricopeptide (TPR) repeat protein
MTLLRNVFIAFLLISLSSSTAWSQSGCKTWNDSDGKEEEPRKNDPCYLATQLQEEGQFSEAVSQYEQCLESAEDDGVKAEVLYNIAFIQTWELNELEAARSNAKKAASLLPEWGKPYILIGDIYTKMSRGSCDDWDKRLAVLAALDKYEYARSIDPEVADDAGRRISNLSGALPIKEEGFMRKVLAGQSVIVGCGIGEMVKVRFQ